jgi:hypothetical protein
VFLTSRYGKSNSSVEPTGLFNFFMAYIGKQDTPGGPMRVLHRAAVDWGPFVRTTGWHGIAAATDAATTFGIGKSMRAGEGKADTGRRLVFSWMTNGYVRSSCACLLSFWCPGG